jgi:hypothetical protein
MKLVVLVLAVLVAIKVGVHEVLYRQATNEVIVSAYRDRAIAACAKEPRAQLLAKSTAWEQPLSLRLMIGKPGVDVYLWQVENQLWNARFVNPYLLVEASAAGTRIVCEYDIVHASATVQNL